MIATPIPLWLDTDIGDDIDDALALALILNTPQLSLQGVTTVFVDAPQRARLAQKILATWQRDEVPVAAGCSQPLLQPIPVQEGRQFAALEGPVVGLPTSPPLQGMHSLLDFVERYSASPAAKATILAIGPLTNIALALALRPDLAGRIRLFMMGGQGTRGTEPEWNIRCDPEAAAMVFAADVEIWQVGYDVTTQVQLTEAQLEQIASHDSAQMQLLWRLIQLWRGRKGYLPYLHDPLAAMALFHNCLEFEPVSATVELCGARRAMIAYADSIPDKTSLQVAVAVDVAHAIELFMENLLLR